MKKLTAIAAAAAMLSSPALAADKKGYVELDSGSTWTQGHVLGAKVGLQPMKFVGFETSYTHVFNTLAPSEIWTGDVVLSVPVDGIKVVPFVLAGVGYKWQPTLNNANQGVWEVGAGLKFDVSSDFALSAQYKYQQGLNDRVDMSVVTIGTALKF